MLQNLIHILIKLFKELDVPIHPIVDGKYIKCIFNFPCKCFKTHSFIISIFIIRRKNSTQYDTLS